MSRFVHLHVHDEYSIADGMSKIDQLVDRASELGMDSLATTNHGNMFSVAKFYKACKKKGIKPIIGAEAYVCPEGKVARVRNNRHIVLLCKNETGYHNLVKIMSEAVTDGYYYNPRTDYVSLKEHSEGLICLTACLGGDVAKVIEADGYSAGVERLKIYTDIFGKDNVYLELQDNGIAEQYVLNDHLIKMSRETGVALVATNDVHYIKKEDYEHHDILMAIQGGTTVDSTNRKKYESDEFYLKSYDEMNSGRLPLEALHNTGAIADRCNFEMEFGKYHLPVYDIPEGFVDSADYLRHLAYEGLRERYPDFEERKEELTERLEYELEVIGQMGFSDYFLITWDFMDYAKTHGIATGPGRGCFTPETQILMSDGSSKEIQNVKAGDSVITHKGNIRKVTNTPKYSIEEEMCRIKAGGFDPIISTTDHKVLTLVTGRCNAPSTKTQYCKFTCSRYSRCSYKTEQETKWVAASELKKGDMLCYPKTKLKDKAIVVSDLASYDDSLKISDTHVWYEIGSNSLETKSINRFITQDAEFARLAGYFIGNGHARVNCERREYSVEISFNSQREDLVNDAANIIYQKFGIETSRYYNEARTCVKLTAHSKVIAIFMAELFGTRAGNKRVPDNLMTSNKEILLQLTYGLFHTDGHLMSKENKISYSTTSISLVYQVQLLLSQLGFYASKTRRVHTNKDWSNELKATLSGKQLIEFSKYFPSVTIHKQRYFRNDFLEDSNYFYVRVSDVSLINYKGTVHDLTVEEDTSFVANGFAVHNSAAGSLLSYSLRITDADPIRFGLIFERFLNPSRISLPDIDIDFCYERRQEVIDYVIDKYGDDRVCQIITFGTRAARSAIRSVARATGVEYLVADKIAKSIPEEIGISIEDAMVLNPDIKTMYDKDTDIRNLIDAAIALEGLPSNTSTHAAGVLISPEPVENIFPVWVNRNAAKKEAVKVVQFDMNILEELGGLKCDFLGLRTLTVISDTIDLIYKNHKVVLTPEDMLNIVDDPTAYHMIAEGCTAGVFQLEGQGMTQVAKELRPESIEEVTALVALYRPGPMDMIPQYIKNKKDPSHIDYVFDDMRDVLEETYGILVYQEQVMFAAQILAGYSMADADSLRKAISKKSEALIKEHKEYFIYGKKENGKVVIPGGIANGHSEHKLIHMYDEIEKFGRYCFNKSHAVVYAMIAVQTSWLKKHYPSEFMASLLTSVSGNQEKVRMYMDHCQKRFGITVAPPSINSSTDKFMTDSDGNIRFALSVAKRVGGSAAREIAYQRSVGGKFISFSDFLYRCYGGLITLGTVEGLIKSGAFDELGLKKSELLATHGDSVEEIKKIKNKAKKSLQNKLFEPHIFANDSVPNLREIPEKILLRMEKESLGIYLSGHPLNNIKAYMEVLSTVKSSDFSTIEDEDGTVLEEVAVSVDQDAEIVGIISSVRQVSTKKGDLMAFVDLEDQHGIVGLVVFPRQFARYRDLLVEDKEVYVKGTVGRRDEDDPNILVNIMTDLEKQTVYVSYVDIGVSIDNEKLREINQIINECPGDIPVYILHNRKYMLLDRSRWVSRIGTEALSRAGHDVTVYKKVKGEI